jgi:hypothetical protein
MSVSTASVHRRAATAHTQTAHTQAAAAVCETAERCVI